MDFSKPGWTSNESLDSAYHMPGTENRAPAHRQRSTGARLTHLSENESPPGPRRLPESSPPSPGGSSSASDHRASRLSAAALSRTGSVACYAAGVLLAAFAALVALPSQAQAQTEVWSGTLPVRDLGFSLHGCSNSITTSHCSSRLTDDDFEHDGTDYAIVAIFVRSSGQLDLNFDTDLTTATQGLELHVDGTAFAFEDADSKPPADRIWFNAGLSWSAGDTVMLTLIEPADATLSDLELEDNTGTAITLTPTFVTGTRSYTASVASSVSAITLTPTVNDTSATVEYLNASNAAITDTDTATPALDAPLVVGANTFKVKVTAGNTTPATETYRVVVTRAADTTAPSLVRAEVLVAGNSVSVTFDEALDLATEFLPAAVVSAFTLTADGVELAIHTIGGSGSGVLAIRLPTGTVIYENQTVKLSYDKTVAGTGALEDAAGNEVATFTDFAVTNNSTVVPTNTPAEGKPTISGPAQVGRTLTAATAGITDDEGLTMVSYEYEWLAAGTVIGGATSATYTLTSSEQGDKIAVRVTFDDDEDNPETLTSDETYEVAPAAATCPTDAATVWCDTLTVGHDLDADGDPTASGYEARTGHDSFGSLSDTTFRHLGVDYTVTLLTGAGTLDLYFATTPNLPADGAGLTVHVQTYGGELDAPLTEGVFLSGNWYFQGKLHASGSAPLSDVPLLRAPYQRGGRINETTDLDTEIMMRLSFANRAAEGTPTISGTAQVGETLTADPSGITDADGLATYTYQWLRVDADGVSNETNIGANAATYTPVAADVGKKIKVQVSFTDDGGTSETLTSAAYPSSGTIMLPAGVTVSNSTLTVTEQNTTGDSYTVVLNSQPTATVTVTVAGHAGTDVTPTPTTLTFTSTTWAMAQTVTVTAGNDTNTANETVSLTHSAASTDTDYSGITIAGVTVTVSDNDGSNTAPVFTGGTTQTRTLAETVGGATAGTAAVGGPVSATDADNNTLTYSLGGTDAGKFGFVTSSGQIRTRAGERYDFEAKADYSVTVTVTDGTVSVTAAVTINITNNTNERPLAPDAPTVTATSGSTTSLNVSWDAPNNTGRPTITGYDLRYRAGTSGGWTDGPQDVSGMSASIAGLTADTSYEVQVRAANGDGNGAWSGAGDGRTSAAARTPEVRFGASSYTAIEGAAGVVVTVELSAAAASAVTITLTEDPQGGATSADYSGVPGSVTFAAGETEQTFTVTAADDSADDDGESVRLGFGPLPSGVQPGSPSTATVALVQDAGVTTWYVWFGESDYTVAEGGTARITLHLNAPWKPELNEALTVPLFDPQHEGGASADDYSGVPESVTFQQGQTRASFTGRATDDSDDDDGESVLLHFRRLFPDDLKAGRYGARVATLHIDDDDGETAVTVSFESANYTAAEGGAAATVRLLLDAAPGRPVTIELTATGRGGATSADYTVPSSVTFGASETVKSFTLTATDDAADDDLESVAIGFGSLPSGVSAGSPSVAVVNLTDNDGGTDMLQVNFTTSAATAPGGVKEGGSYFVSFRLNREPGRILTIPLTYAYLGGATAADFTDLPSAVTFGKNKRSAGVTISAVDDFDVDPEESIRVSFGTMPTGVSVGSYGGPSIIIRVIDSDGLPGLSVADASAGEWPNKRVCLVFEVTLDRKVDDVVSVDYATADGTAVAGQDYVRVVSGTLEFRKGQNRKRLCVEVIYDEIDESTEKMTLRLYNPVGAYLSDATATGWINSASGDRAPEGESEALDMVAGLSVEAVARVLFGEAELSADQRAALDYLGNRNGVLDLGDLLSWRARCRRDEVRCGGPGSAAGAGSVPASPAAPPTKRDRRTPSRRRGDGRAGRRSGRNMGGSLERVPQQPAMRSGAAGRGPGRARGPVVRRRAGWIRALVPGLVVSAWGCGIGEDLIQPVQPDPGPLHVRLAVPPQARDIGAMLVVEGPGIDSLSAPGFELIQADEASSNRREAIMAGSLSTGPVLQVWVPDRRQLGHYRVELVQVAGDDYGLRDVAQYGIAISR